MIGEPLASKYRPKSLKEIVGQQHLLAQDKPLDVYIKSGNLPSMILWGPPGSGKTTIAYVISQDLRYEFYKLSAVTSGKAKLMQVMKIAQRNLNYNKRTVLFIDEIHRWNKAQQDALLPYVEKGAVILIGATTENPSFSINNALISRCKVLQLEPIPADLMVDRLHTIARSEAPKIKVHKKALNLIAQLVDGDMRRAINILESAINLVIERQGKSITEKFIRDNNDKVLFYDKDGEEHYNIISAVHKSMRSSDGNAAAYWVARMLAGGDDPVYIARRLVRFAAEDIGNADPQALILADSVMNSCKNIGMPECEVHLIQLAKYLSDAPKDNSAYAAMSQIHSDIEQYGQLPVPMHLRNAPTKLMKEFGYGKGYRYDHDEPGKKSGQQCLPDELADQTYF